MTCRCCGRPEPGPLPADSLAAIAGPRIRPTIAGKAEPICLACILWSARLGRVIA